MNQNQELIWTQVSGQGTSSQFICRLVTKNKETCLQGTCNEWKKQNTANMRTEILTQKLQL